MLNFFVTIANSALFLLQLGLLLVAGYLLFLTIAAWVAYRRGVHVTPLRPYTRHRFLFLIPAHNEEALLPKTLANLKAIDYPDTHYAIHVVADNCSDKTAELARAGGAEAHERFNDEKRGKGYALQWLLQRLWDRNEVHDAIIILDADSIVSANFLRVMDKRLTQGERIIQSYYAVQDPGSSWNVGLRYAALSVLHYLRPLGRTTFNGTTGLKGNGMVFAAEIMRGREWTSHLTEDIEFHMELVLDGERVSFAPDAIVWAEMPTTLAGSATQNARWERGRIDMAKTYIPKLLRQATKGPFSRRIVLVDAAMEHLIPPFSILVGLSAVSLMLSAILFAIQPMEPFALTNLAIALFILFAQLIYVFSGLRMVEAPRSVYSALLRAPMFMLWKIMLYGRVLFGRDEDEWIRTTRNAESS